MVCDKDKYEAIKKGMLPLTQKEHCFFGTIF
jgi:hypothetical protein